MLYQIVHEYSPEFQAELVRHGKHLPAYVTKEFDEYLKCGRLEYGFLRVRCESCREEKLVAFSCKRRGFCPVCGARRMADSAALLVDEILPHQPMRQWVLQMKTRQISYWEVPSPTALRQGRSEGVRFYTAISTGALAPMLSGM